jgi:hypothetical protein
MDIGKSITFAFDDEDWLTKLGLGAVVSAVPLLNFAWTGYLIDLMRNVARGEPNPLPDWSDIGDKLVRGLVVSLATFIYFLPAILVGCVAFTSFLLPAIFANEDYVDQIAIGSSGLGLVLFCCIGLFALAISFFMPAVYINYSRQGTFASCFRLGEILGIISENLSDYLTAFLVSTAVSFVASFALSIGIGAVALVPCVGIFIVWALSAVVSAWLMTIYGHLFGQVGAK